MSKIFVVGSINVDYVMEISHLPQLGETLPGTSFLTNFGGKGANQAVALAKQEEDVYFIANVGNDSIGQEAIENLNQYGVHTEFIQKIDNQTTGAALILVENHNNRILLHAGANQKMQQNQILEAFKLANPEDYLLVQLEINMDMVYYAIQEAKKRKMHVVMNPAPAQSIADKILDLIDILIVNEIECKMLTGYDYTQENELNAFLKNHSISIFIVTLGEKGAHVFTLNNKYQFDAHLVHVKDTTAAGDTFIGAFLSEWIHSNDLKKSAQYAIIASALSCMTLGAQKSIKNRQEIQKYILTHL